jgi:hypothetical protein
MLDLDRQSGRSKCSKHSERSASPRGRPDAATCCERCPSNSRHLVARAILHGRRSRVPLRHGRTNGHHTPDDLPPSFAVKHDKDSGCWGGGMSGVRCRRRQLRLVTRSGCLRSCRSLYSLAACPKLLSRRPRVAKNAAGPARFRQLMRNKRASRRLPDGQARVQCVAVALSNSTRARLAQSGGERGARACREQLGLLASADNALAGRRRICWTP